MHICHSDRTGYNIDAHTAVLQNLAKKNRQPSDVNFTHAQNFLFIFKVKLHACAKIDVGIFCKIL